MRKLLSVFLIIVGIASCVFAGIYQLILLYEKFGFIIFSDTTQIIIPHWSAWFYLGAIPLFFGFMLDRWF